MLTTPTVFEVTEATGFQFFSEKRVRSSIKTADQTAETAQFLRIYAREIAFAKKMLAHAKDGSQLPHHLKNTYLRYTNTVTKEFFEPKHTYFKFDGKIYAALKRGDLLGTGQTSDVKRVVDVETGKLAALKLLKGKALSDDGSLLGKSDDLPLIDLIPVIATGKKKANPLKSEDYFSMGYFSADETGSTGKNSDEIPFSSDISLKTNLKDFASMEKHFQLMTYSEETLSSYTHKKAAEIFKAKHALTMTNNPADLAVLERKIALMESTLAADLQKIFLKSVKALDALHSGALSKTKTKYVHTDVKPDNILISVKSEKGPHKKSLMVSFCDIDSRVPLDEAQDGMSLSTSWVSGHGTPGYLSPEAPTPHSTGELRYSVKSDIYALGKTFETLLKIAFSGNKRKLLHETQEKIHFLESIAERMCDDRLLPDQRPSLNAVEKALIMQQPLQYENLLERSITFSPSLFSRPQSKASRSTVELTELAKESEETEDLGKTQEPPKAGR